MASRSPHSRNLVMLARSLGIEAEFSVWSEVKGDVRLAPPLTRSAGHR
jgi:hypothetical protein